MSIRSQAASDARVNINLIGDPVKLTTPNGATSYNLIGTVQRVEGAVDTLTGEKIIMPRTEITLALGDLPAGGISELWRVSITDSEGTAVAGNVTSPVYDRAIGFVNFKIEAVN